MIKCSLHFEQSIRKEQIICINEQFIHYKCNLDQLGSTEIMFKFGWDLVKLQQEIKTRERQNEVFTLALPKSTFQKFSW